MIGRSWFRLRATVLCLTLLVTGAGTAIDAEARTGALERIAAGRAMTIAYAPNAYPLSFRDADGAPRGYAIDLCRHIIEGIQSQLQIDALELAWLEGNTPRRLAAVSNGEADIECGTTTVTLTRQTQVDFSNIVFVESGGLLVRRDSGITTLAGLGGQRIGVVPETTTERRLRPALAAARIGAELVPIHDAKDGRERLIADELDAVAGDRLVLLGQIAETDNAAGFAIVAADFSVEPYAFALPRNDADFRLAVNRALAGVYRSGEVDRIFTRWFGTDAEPTPLLQTIFFIYGFTD